MKIDIQNGDGWGPGEVGWGGVWGRGRNSKQRPATRSDASAATFLGLPALRAVREREFIVLPFDVILI